MTKTPAKPLRRSANTKNAIETHAVAGAAAACLPAALRSRNSSRCMVSLPAAMSPLVENVVAAVEIGHKAAGFAHQKDARGHVPRRQIALPIGVEPAGGDIGEIERGGAEAAQPGEMLLRGGDFRAGPSARSPRP